MFKYIILISLSSALLSAHSGRTDSNGGHRCTATGTYHYHFDPIPEQQASQNVETELNRQDEVLPLVKKS